MESTIIGLYHYHRIGHDERPLELLANGLIGEGGSAVEQRWELRNGGNVRGLAILGEFGEICRLHLDPDGCWRGAWTQFERMKVELMPQRLQPLRSLVDRGGITHVPNRFHYISYAQLVADCHAFARTLPPVRAIAGVPRSGLIPAAVMALELNVPMVSLESLISAEDPTIQLPRRGTGHRVSSAPRKPPTPSAAPPPPALLRQPRKKVCMCGGATEFHFKCDSQLMAYLARACYCGMR